MHHGAVSERWDHTSALMCLTANLHRDPKRQRKPFTPDQFHPMRQPKKAKRGIPINKQTIQALKVFC